MGGAVKAITTVVGAVVGFMVGGPIGAMIGAGLGYASSDLINAIINPGFNVPNTGYDAAGEQNQGVLVNKQGTNLWIPVVYGQRKMGGYRVFVSTEGGSNEYLHIVMVFAEGEINRFTHIYCDDNLAWTGSSSHATRYEANQGKYSGLMSFETFHGQPNQSASRLTLGVGGWSNDHRLRGLAYISFKLRWLKIEKAEDQDKSPWSNIPNITVILEGKKVADATGFADSTTRATAYDSESTAYNNNPINCLLDYLRNPIYGKGLTNDRIDFASFRREAIRWRYLSDGTTLATGDQFQECNAIIFTDRTIFDNVKTFLFNIQGALPYFNGRFSVKVEDNRDNSSAYGTTSTPVMTIGEDAIIGSINIESESVAGKFNKIIVSYPGGRQNDVITNELVETQWPVSDSALEAQYLQEDNNRINENRVTYEHITQDSVALKRAQVAMAKSRLRGKIVSFTADASAHQLTVNDIFTLNYTGLGINGKFRVKSLQFNADYTFSIIAEEHDDQVYGGNITPYRRRTPSVIRVGDPGSQPVYVDENGNVIWEGNKSDLEKNPLAPDDPNNPTPGVSYTLEDLEEAMASGRAFTIVNGEIIYGDAEWIPPITGDDILGYTSVPAKIDPNGSVDIRINITARSEPNIESTVVYVYNSRSQTYDLLFPANGSTAARDGYVLINTWGTRLKNTLNVKVGFNGRSSNLKSVSPAFTIECYGPNAAIPNNRIKFEEF